MTAYFLKPLFAAALAIAPAAALEARPAISHTVSYADLDLTKRADQRRLELRIDSAIARLCGDPRAARNGFELEQANKCRDQARTNVAPQLALAQSRSSKARQVAISIAPR